MSKKIRIDESTSVGTKSASVTITAEPLEIEIDPLVLALGPAEAIANSIRVGIQNSGEQVSEGTARQRKARGIAGRTKWNATGELARGIRAEQDGRGYSIVAPPGRLQDDEVAQKLVEDIEEIAEPVTRTVEAAIEKTANEMISIRRR
jgi:hypothetical protein